MLDVVDLSTESYTLCARHSRLYEYENPLLRDNCGAVAQLWIGFPYGKGIVVAQLWIGFRYDKGIVGVISLVK